MTEPDSKFEEEVRRALCAAGDLVVPAGDGLNKIRARSARRPYALAWILAYATHLPRRLLTWLRVAGSEVNATAHGHSSLSPALRSPKVWIRPLLAATAALAIVIAAMLAVPRLRQPLVATLSGSSGSSQNGGGAGGGLGGGVAQSSRASAAPQGTIYGTLGQPVDAILPSGTSFQCRTHGSKAAGQQTGGTVIPPVSGSGPTQRVGAGTLGGGQAAGTVAGGPVGPPAPSIQAPACPDATSSPWPTPTPTLTEPTSQPPTSVPPTSTPPTSTPPTSTPPTSTPPTSTPPTSTPPTTTPPTTSSPNGSASPTGPTGTADPGPVPS